MKPILSTLMANLLCLVYVILMRLDDTLAQNVVQAIASERRIEEQRERYKEAVK